MLDHLQARRPPSARSEAARAQQTASIAATSAFPPPRRARKRGDCRSRSTRQRPGSSPASLHAAPERQIAGEAVGCVVCEAPPGQRRRADSPARRCVRRSRSNSTGRRSRGHRRSACRPAAPFRASASRRGSRRFAKARDEGSRQTASDVRDRFERRRGRNPMRRRGGPRSPPTGHRSPRRPRASRTSAATPPARRRARPSASPQEGMRHRRLGAEEIAPDHLAVALGSCSSHWRRETPRGWRDRAPAVCTTARADFHGARSGDCC